MTSLPKGRSAPNQLEDGDLGELHVAATYAHHAGNARVEIDPLAVVELVERVQVAERALAELKRAP